MSQSKSLVWSIGLAVLVAAGAAAFYALAPSGEETPRKPVEAPAQAPAGPVMEILWEDLLPEGEIERLEQLYRNYYAQLEQRYSTSRQMTLSQAGDQNAADGFPDIAEGSAADTMPQLGTFNVVEDLDGKTIRMPGYIVPLDFRSDNKYTEFLLVPYMGACLHSPPPPPNQIVYVRADEPVLIESIWLPFWAQGTMKTERNENATGNAAYTLMLHELEPYAS